MESYNLNEMAFNKFKLPRRLERDSEYIRDLKERLFEYRSEVEAIKNFPLDRIKNIRENIEGIIKSLNYYYNADIEKARNEIMRILRKYKGNKFICSDMNRNYAFRGVAPFENLRVDDYDYENMNTKELNFFRARIDEEKLTRTEMLHVPFNLREIIKTQRFSIAGVPCLYLGTTSYVCWLEMNKPKDSEFNVSSYKMNGKFKILNLVGNQMLINGLISNCNLCDKNKKEMCMDELEVMIEIFPLVFATSYNIKGNDRAFKSEYIISQLIMQCLGECNIDGVAYLSKKMTSETMGYMQSVNVAIPIKYEGNYIYKEEPDMYGKICEKIELTTPVNFDEYQKINESPKLKESFVNLCYHGEIELAGSNILYSKCKFSDFDNYLVSLEHLCADIYEKK